MPSRRIGFCLNAPALILVCVIAASVVQAQGVRQVLPGSTVQGRDADHARKREEWFLSGRMTSGQSPAELRRRAYQAKLQLRARTAAAQAAAVRARNWSLA